MAGSPEDGHESARGGIDRRRFLIRAGAVGAAAWAVPTIATMRPAAAAEVTSPPPEPPGPPPPKTVPPPPTVTPEDLVPPPAPSPRVVPTSATRAQSLPNTGTDPEKLLAAGLTAIAGGAALSLWSADGARRAPAVLDVRQRVKPPLDEER